MSTWYAGTVKANVHAAAGLHALRIDVSGTPLAGSHSLPGQYLRLKTEEAGTEGFFAIASGPDAQGTFFELLIKHGSPLADALIRTPVGTRLFLTAPEGPGFPVDSAAGSSVLLFATGSGISAIRSLIHSILPRRADFGEVTLYFGARSADAFAYQDEFGEWMSRDIRIIQTVSGKQDSGWKGLRGYVQHHLPQDKLEHAVAYVCGQPEMVDGVKRALVHRGVPEQKIFLNV